MSPKIIVSIINYRTYELTINCVSSVLDAMDQHDVHTVVVDNDSNDGSAEKIDDWIQTKGLTDRVSLVQSKTNSGFSGGHNQGIQYAEAEFYLILNSDALLRHGFFDAILSAADQDKGAGFIAPRLEDEDGTPQVSCFRFHSPIGEFVRAAHTGFITRVLKRWDIPLGIDPKPANIEWASFACILVRQDVVDSIGLMDDDYFLYYEDEDYCFSARQNGWAVGFAPEARAVHFRGGSGPVKALEKQQKRRPKYYYESRARFFRKAYGRHGFIIGNCLWWLGRAIANGRRLIGKDVPTIIEREGKDIWIRSASTHKDQPAEA